MKSALTFITILGAVLFAALLPVAAQQQFQGVCNRVKIEIEQELTTERIGFEAVLKVTNNDGEDPLNQFSASLTFTDSETGEDASDRFFIRTPELSSINRIDGTGVISPTKTAIVTWFIIPKTGENAPGGTDPRGKEYLIGCNLSGYIRGDKIPDSILFANPDTITVKPEPFFDITYFQPRHVTGDNPFTPEVESPIPFTLGVLVQNNGYGIAKSVKIDSKQPKIVENKNGLLLIARLLGASVQDAPLDETSLLVDLGDINPASVKKGAWYMITSLSGEFIEFKASYRHAADLGGLETSVINSLNAHFFAREALNDEPGRDTIMDFLADTDRDSNEIPDTLYETDGAILPVNHQPQAEIVPLSGGQTTVTLAADREGWVYMRLTDPAQASYPITSVLRSDGKFLNPRNFWTSIQYRPSDNFKLTYLHLFDRVENGAIYSYLITYDTNNSDTTAPITRIRFSGESSGADPTFYITPETQIYFTSEDASPVAIEYSLDGAAYRPAIPFRLDLPGTYNIDYFATDNSGNEETPKSATLIVPGAGVEIPLIAGESSIFPTDLLSIRPSETPIRATVPPSSLDVNGELIIYRGVIARPSLAGLPVSPTPATEAQIEVSGQFVQFYKYRLNGGPWSTEAPVANPIQLSALAGPVTLEVLARHGTGPYLPDSEALPVSWEVDPTAEDISVTGVPPSPTTQGETVTLTFNSSDSSLYRWAPGNSFFRAEEPYTTPVLRERLTEGSHLIRIITNAGGTFPDEITPDPVASLGWIFDRNWGFDFSTLEEVRRIDLGEVAGQNIEFVWDGKDQAGVQQIPGPYTAFLQLTDSLGNVNRAATLIEIEGLSADRTVLADATLGPRNLRSRGNWAVWEQRDGSVANIHAAHLAAGTPSVALTSSTDFDQEDPATDGSFVVWQSRLSNGATDILYRSLTTPGTNPVTSTPGLIEANPVVEWPWFAYQVKSAASPSAPWQIEAYNADTAERFLVSPGQGDQFRPQIHGGRLVWEDHRDVGPGEIYFTDLETRAVQRITNNTFGQNNPAIFGNHIAWQDNRNGQVDIWMRDLRGGLEEQVTATAFNERDPVIEGNWLVFTEDSLGPSTENIVLHDLQAGSQLALTRATRQHILGGLGAGFGTWIESSGGDRSVVASRLPGLQAVMTSSNALAVSPGLVARFGSAFDLLQDWGGPTGIRSVSLYQSITPLVVQTANYNGGSPSGDDFPLTAGSFLWVEFEAANLVDLGNSDTAALTLAAGLNIFSYTGFPVGYTAYDLINSAGPTKVKGMRLYDAFAGLWRSVEIDPAGLPTGPNFTIPRVTTLLLDMREAATVTPNL